MRGIISLRITRAYREIAGGNASVGTVSAGGLYTAPLATTTVTVTAYPAISYGGREGIQFVRMSLN